MRTKLVKIANLIIVAMFALFIAGYVFAWFNNDAIKRELEMEGASAAYFESGSGTYEDPFIISNERHVYNLSWLNNTGRLGDTKYYFKVINAITISDNDWIPPIGTDAHPFYGDFDGGGYTITNLKVTTDKSKLRNSRYGTAYTLITEADYAFSKAVGFFGKTAEGSNVHNFILDNPTVVVSSENSKYSSSGNSVVGLAIGHVGENASSIGVRDGNLAVEVNSYKSFNSILGELGAEAQNNMTSGSAGFDNGDTGYFIPSILFDKISQSDGTNALSNFFNNVNKDEVSVKYENSWLVAGENNSLGLGSFSVATSNVNDEIRSSTITNFIFYPSATGNTYTSVAGQDIEVSLSGQLTGTAAEIQSNVVDQSGARIYVLDHAWYFEKTDVSGSIPDAGNPLYVVSEDNNFMNADGTVSETAVTGNYAVNRGGIKVNIISASKGNPSKIFIIAAANNKDDRYVGLYKIYDNSTVGGDINYNDFAVTQTGGIYTSDKREDTYNRKSDMIMQLYLPGAPDGTLNPRGCYFEVEEPGVYQIQSTSGGVNFYYLSVEGVSSGQGGLPPATERFELDNIDFIEDGDSISDGKLVTGTQAYNPTETWVFLTEVANAIYISYTRNNVADPYRLSITLYNSFDDESDKFAEGDKIATNDSGVYADATTNYGVGEMPFDGETHKVKELVGTTIPDDITVGPSALVCYYEYNGPRQLEGEQTAINVDKNMFTASMGDSNYIIDSIVVTYNGQVLDDNTVSIGEGTHIFNVTVVCHYGDDVRTFSRDLTIKVSRQYTYHFVSFATNVEDYIVVDNMPEDQEVKDGEKAYSPTESPVRDGYTFGGWYTVPECTEGYEYNFDTPVTEDVTLYAKWTQNAVQTYTVTFMYGTSEIDTITVNAGGKVEKPTDPTKDGYTFGGWYTDDTFATQFDFANTVINGDTTIYAKWIDQSDIFNVLKSREDNILAEDFAVYETGTSLGIYSSESLVGVYASGAGGGSVVVTEDNKIKHSPVAGANTDIVIAVGQMNSIEGYLEFSASAMGTKWALLQFLSGGSEIFALYTSSTGELLTVRVGGLEQPISSNVSRPQANTLCKVHFIISPEHKVTIYIDGVVLIADYDVGTFDYIDSIKIPTSNSGARIVTLDNVSICGLPYVNQTNLMMSDTFDDIQNLSSLQVVIKKH